MDKEQRAKLLTEIVETNQKNGLYEGYIGDTNKMVTAVEWLEEQLKKQGFLYDLDIEAAKQMEKEQNNITENTSDGYHTFKELYDFRMLYNVALFNEWALQSKYEVHKSWRHNDGELCFGGGWFIVVAILPTGQISNHYSAEYWDLFNISETTKALYPFDGHTSQDVIDRLKFMNHMAQQNKIGNSDKSQTAVEWLIKQISEILGPLKTEAMTDLLLVDAIQKAKQMEKEQIKVSYGVGHNDGCAYMTNNKPDFEDQEQYYNETYNK